MSKDGVFSCIRAEGGLLPPDLLTRVAQRAGDLEGMSPSDYGLLPSERLNEGVTRSWNRLLGAWESFKEQRRSLPVDDPAVEVTRRRWLLPLLDELGFGTLPPTRARDLEGKTYPISHEWAGSVPIHLLGVGVDLDRRSRGVAGAATASPHGLVQEYLNRSDHHLWGVVSNGLRLRLVRDNAALTRQSFVEFDLERMFEGQAYAEFAVLWLTLHATRFEGDPPEKCLLERWKDDAAQRGTRALDRLRVGVQKALEALGDGALAHHSNGALRERLRTGGITHETLYRQLLRTVYRLLFLLVAESRDLIHAPDTDPTARHRYDEHYSLERLRRLAEATRGSAHADLWAGLRVVFAGLSSPSGLEPLGLPALGSFLWSNDATPDLDQAEIDNRHVLEAIRALCWTRQGRAAWPVDYRNLGSEELGSIYESLLELVPQADAASRTFRLQTAPGNERKTSGSYYTPSSLIAQILDDALDPVLDEAAGDKPADEAEAAILALTVCDPACGSAHFLVAAAHRMAKRLAAVRTGDTEPSPLEIQQALRDVVSRCIYGVDVNPMAVELAKVSLWLECHVPGQPLTFLDHHIKCGNSLLGVHHPDLMVADGPSADQAIPDTAFKALPGDDKTVVSSFRKANQQLRAHGAQETLLFSGRASDDDAIAHLAADSAQLTRLDDESIAALEAKRSAWAELEHDPERTRLRLAADAWCAAFTCLKTKDVLRQRSQHPWDVFYACERGQVPPSDNDGVRATQVEAERFGFFHWFVEFPEIHAAGGFSVMLGNPPWERIKIQEKEWFATRDPEIAKAANKAARTKLINQLAEAPDGTPERALATEWSSALHQAAGESHLIRASDLFPLGGVGDVNVYAVFADLFRQLITTTGRAGFLCPVGLAVGATYAGFFSELVRTRTIACFYSFENEDRIFPEVHNETKFAIVVLAGIDRPATTVEFTGYVRQPTDIKLDERRYRLTADDIEAINPNTLTAPLFRRARDADVTKAIHQHIPILVHHSQIDSNPWEARYLAMFHMANDADRFLTEAQLLELGAQRHGNRFGGPSTERYLPLYEGKMLWHFDHRYGTYDGQTEKQSNKGVLPHVGDADHDDPQFQVLPRYWLPAGLVDDALTEWPRDWLLAFRDVGPSERTMVCSFIPRTAAGNKAPLLLSGRGRPILTTGFYAALASLVVDFALRQKTSSAMSLFVVEQAPIPPPETFEAPFLGHSSLLDLVVPRVVELSYTAWDLRGFADDCGFGGPPFRWVPERRAVVQAELDALFFHLYGLERDDTEWVIDSFTVLRKYEERPPERGGHGEFRTKRLVLERYDAMASAIAADIAYETPLSPPPADDSMRHPT